MGINKKEFLAKGKEKAKRGSGLEKFNGMAYYDFDIKWGR
jgi:hypothetical protein